MIASYKTIGAEAKDEYIVNKSVFIATVAHVETEKDAKAFIDRIKKEYYDARHNCYAYVLREDGEKKKSSDDGEPSGTAGRPILEVIEKNELTDIIVVVTRYFGGVLLGTGGLVRAYSTAASMAVKKSQIDNMLLCDIISFEANYKDAENIKNILDKTDILIENVSYGEKVIITVKVPVGTDESLMENINFNGNISAKKLGTMYARAESIVK